MKAGTERQRILTHKVASWHGTRSVRILAAKQSRNCMFKKKRNSITSLLPSVGRSLAHQPATGSVTCRKNIRWDAEQEKKTKVWYIVSDMARRLAAGRTPELLLSLMETRLFSVAAQPV